VIVRRFVTLFAIALTFVSTSHADSAPKNEPALKRPEKSQIVATTLKAYNDAAGKELFGLCGKSFQQSCPPARLDQVLKQARCKYGRFIDDPVAVEGEKNPLVYRIRCEKRTVYLRIALDEGGLVAGIAMAPAFLEGLPSTLSSSQLQQRLREAVDETLRAYRLPSISLALVKNDRIVWERAFGHLNVAKSVPADPETVYATGSAFKVVVATALLRLVDEGKIALDAPIRESLNGLQIANPYDKETPLTLRHLLSHHSGMSNGAQIVSLWGQTTPLTLEETLKKHGNLVTRPGTQFEYSNYGYALCGYLLGKLSNKSVESTLREEILDPLGMTHTAFEPSPAMNENLALPYQSSVEGLTPIGRVRFDVYPGADVYSTPADMARFLILHLNNGKIGGSQIISAKAITEMAQPQFSKAGEKSGAGLGWMIEHTPRRKLLWHNGAIPGFYSQMAIDPDRKVGVVLFTNSHNTLESSLGIHADPLADLRDLAIELLARLEH
jgi:CubicO group peptidase (beta-lactamase class C family)